MRTGTQGNQSEEDRRDAVLRWASRHGPALAVAAGFVACLLLPVVLGLDDHFMDELYYLACGSRPALGYADHPS